MPSTIASPLEALARRITEREAELTELRREYKARQGQLAELARRKQELEGLLCAVEDQLRSFGSLQAGRRAASPAKALSPRPATAGTPSGGPTRLGELLTTILKESRQPRTVKQLAEGALQRGWVTASKNVERLVKKKVQQLREQGVLARAQGQPGYVLSRRTPGAATNGAAKSATSPGATTAPSPAAKPGPKAAVPSSTKAAAPHAGKGTPGKQPPLRDLLRKHLKNAKQPLSGSELAAKVQASGYKSSSAQFRDVVWSMLGQMEGVEHVRGQGYRLKGRK